MTEKWKTEKFYWEVDVHETNIFLSIIFLS